MSPRSATPSHPVLRQRKLVLTLAVLLAALGLISWLTMVRQEDPRLPELFGMITVTFPGADAETMERLVLDPIEDELGRVEEIAEIRGTANAEIAFLDMDLDDSVEDTDAAWDRVRLALDRAHGSLPEGASVPLLDDRQQDAESIVYAVSGHPDPLVLGEAAEVLEEILLNVPGVQDVTLVSEPGEQITVELSTAEARRLGLAPGQLAAQLAARNQILPGGSVQVGDRSVRLRPKSEFGDLAEIRATAVRLPGGGTVPLQAIAQVRRGPEEPARSRMRSDGQPAVGVGVVAESGINVVRWGEAVRQRMADIDEEVAARLGPTAAGIEVRERIYQPARVEARLANLNRSLLTGALVVAVVLILVMGPRLGLVVAAVVPLVSLSAMAVYAVGGGILHQMSIAAVVIALGMLVDNAIVMAEAIQWRIDQGEPPALAAGESLRELAIPLAGATGTTLAAFVPMLLAEGVTAIFTRAIPVVIMITLAVSYLFAVYVTPSLAAMVLRPRPKRASRGRLSRALGRLAVERPGTVLASGLVVVLIAFSLFPLVRQEFFPESDRNQLVVDLKLPEGSHLDATDRVARHLERDLLPLPEVSGVLTFIGRSAPHFYYNLSQIPWSPHFGQMVLQTASLEDLDPVMRRIRQFAAEELPEAEVVVRKLEQGPPVSAPVEVRLFGDDLDALHTGAEQVMQALREVPGTADVRHDLSPGSPVLRFEIDDAAAGRHGLTRVEVADALYGATRGLPVGWYRAEDDPVPVVVRSGAGERLPLAELESLDVTGPRSGMASEAGMGGGFGSGPVPLAQVARLDAEWRPGAILHFDRRRSVSVSSQLADGFTYSDVTRRLTPRLETLEMPPGVELRMAGAAESSGEANTAMISTVPAGILLLLGILMAEFRSFRRVGIVLVTVPLAVAGIVPGLLLGDQPFGFMSLLGVLALAGVVVNNAIVLLEVVESRRREGASIPQAVADAVERRVRPILLTTATTVLGLLPLALSPSTLWPPLAWTMISGLLASTLLTLLVVPSLYMLFFRPRRVVPMRWPWRRTVEAGVLVLALSVWSVPWSAEVVATDRSFSVEAPVAPATAAAPLRLTLAEAMRLAESRPRVRAAHHRAAAARHGATATARAGRYPTVEIGAQVTERDRELELVTPIGDFPFGDRRSEAAQLTVVQPLFVPQRQFYAAPAARADARAAELMARREAQVSALIAAEAFLDVLAVEAAMRSTEAFVTALDGQLSETEARAEAGRVLESDALKVRLARDSAAQDRLALEQRLRVALADLARAVGESRPVEPVWAPVWAPAGGEIAETRTIPGGGEAGMAEVATWGESGEAMDSVQPSSPPSSDFLAALPPVPPRVTALERALDARPDLAALSAGLEAADLRHSEVRAELWPSLRATASYTWQGGSPYAEDAWAEGGVVVAWRPFSAGSRGARAAARAEEAVALAADRAEAVRGVEMELAAGYADLATAEGALEVGESGVRQARETLRVERRRHAAGRVTTNDLLAAEAALRQQRTRRDVAALDVVRARARVWTALGRSPATPHGD